MRDEKMLGLLVTWGKRWDLVTPDSGGRERGRRLIGRGSRQAGAARGSFMADGRCPGKTWGWFDGSLFSRFIQSAIPFSFLLCLLPFLSGSVPFLCLWSPLSLPFSWSSVSSLVSCLSVSLPLVSPHLLISPSSCLIRNP